MQMSKSENRRTSNLILLCACVYFFSYLTRLNYSAVLVEMIASEGFAKTAASAALTGLFITYGIGQLISGYLGDRIAPNLLIFFGLIMCAAMNLLIPVCKTTTLMTIVWSINGFAQAMMWPPLVRIMSQQLPEELYKKATVRVNWGASVGTIFIYLTAPIYIKISGWRLVFIVSAVMALIMAFVWRALYPKMTIAPKQASGSIKQQETETTHMPHSLFGMLALVMMGIVMQGCLRDGITTWMPTYLAEAFTTENTIAILVSVVLPVFAMLVNQATLTMNSKLIKNELTCAAVIFLAGVLALAYLSVAGACSFVGTILALAVSVGSMHGVNLILVCMLPKFFARFGKVSLISGVLNSCTYVGSAVSTYGIALLTERFGWGTTTLVWLSIAALGTVCCLLCARRWTAFKNEK